MCPEGSEGTENRTAAVKLLVKKIPNISHRAVAIANMTSLRSSDYAFCRAGVTADNQVVLGKVEKLCGQRKQSREKSMMLENTRESL
jgi:hypothetical protein